ncbi:diguanylate cyclase [Marinobacter sp. S6332]|uniref:sensor domain-containing diguanylate cyclase n=1 Tax=Marinobacter sp. S6332 TaxID=2926403 RepID=UPI001FF4649B|nr:diguanylate cyclase [Marinobacter sp. S6332]MCK0164399.1 sensor domain-containing diguanylate cyclase [Marinobacter sp. S6332]
MQKHFGLLCIFILLFMSVSAFSADQEAMWGKHSTRMELASYVDYWQEPAVGRAGISEITRLGSDVWTRNGSDSVNLGYGQHVYWFRMGLENVTGSEANTFLEIGYPVLDHIEVYINPSQQLEEPLILGDKQPFYDRPILHRNFVVPITLAPKEKTTIYLRVKTTSSMQVPLTLWNQNAFYSVEQARSMFEGLYYGIVLVMILYNLFVFLAVGERSFLHYVGFMVAMPLFLSSFHGVAFQYLWPEATWWNDQSIIVFLSLVVLFGGIFTIKFINVTRENHPVLNPWTQGIVIAAGLMAVSGFLIPYKYLILPTILVASVGCSTLLLLSIVRWVKKDPAARYYTLAWVFVLSGGLVLALSKFTLLPSNLLTENATQVGSALGVILLSIALADRLNKDKKRVFEAQQGLLREERKARVAQAKTLEIQREANALLEERVQERTRDLERLNSQLLELSSTDALTELKNRGHFDREFQSAVVHAYRHQEPLSLLLLDIDYFKQFNDNHGHLVGDDCLKMVAQCVRQLVTRPQDLAARYGGEEFVVLLPNTPHKGAVDVAERIRKAVEKMAFPLSGQTLHLTISVGVCSELPASADATEALFSKADEALYQAKANGRNCVVAWSASSEDAATANVQA